jgi:hypothetical protein
MFIHAYMYRTKGGTRHILVYLICGMLYIYMFIDTCTEHKLQDVTESFRNVKALYIHMFIHAYIYRARAGTRHLVCLICEEGLRPHRLGEMLCASAVDM